MPTPLFPCAPARELSQSPAARRVAELAHRCGLRLAHFEYRRAMVAPEHWLPPSASAPPTAAAAWESGVLKEHKYASFRTDGMVGSFHPSHRGKWTAHELCHGIVGFAWAADDDLLTMALSARAAEVLPVALWYFFDEAGLRRCPRHGSGGGAPHQGALFSKRCAACEAIAGRPLAGHLSRESAELIAAGRAFVAAELASIRASMATGRAHFYRYATLDLMSDGLAYAAANRERLRSEAFADYVRLFCPAGAGFQGGLEQLLQRVEALTDWIAGDGPGDEAEMEALVFSAAEDDLAVRQDMGWRLLEVHEETEGDARGALGRIITDFAGGQTDVAGVIAAYEGLFERYVLAEPEEVFAVGYPLPGAPGYGLSVSQITQGLWSCCPRAMTAAGSEAITLVTRFAQQDAGAPERSPLGRRFAKWMADSAGAADRNGAADAAALAAFEASVAHPAVTDEVEATLGWDGVAFTDETLLSTAIGCDLVRGDFDLAGWSAHLDPAQTERRPHHYAVMRDGAGGVAISALSPMAYEILRRRQEGGPAKLGADEDSSEAVALADAGLLLPAR